MTTPSPQDLLSTLDQLMATTSGQERWQQLTTLLDTWPDKHLKTIIPRLQDELRDDTSPRTAPKAWLTFRKRLSNRTVKLHTAWPLAPSISRDATSTIPPSPRSSTATPSYTSATST